MRAMALALMLMALCPGVAQALCICPECLSREFQSYQQVAGAMLPGIAPSDCVVVQKNRLPETGEIAVVRSDLWPAPVIIRVIATGGQQVEILDGLPIVDGIPATRELLGQPPAARAKAACVVSAAAPDCKPPLWRETLPSGQSYEVLDMPDAGMFDNIAKVRVPDGYVFVMGDNRDIAMDSRAGAVRGAGIEMIATRDILGTVTRQMQ